jgi:hypothetical protein
LSSFCAAHVHCSLCYGPDFFLVQGDLDRPADAGVIGRIGGIAEDVLKRPRLGANVTSIVAAKQAPAIEAIREIMILSPSFRYQRYARTANVLPFTVVSTSCWSSFEIAQPKENAVLNVLTRLENASIISLVAPVSS